MEYKVSRMGRFQCKTAIKGWRYFLPETHRRLLITSQDPARVTPQVQIPIELPPELPEPIQVAAPVVSLFSLPPTFRIGKVNPPPVVTIDELLAHLKLLGAFDKLQKEVRSQEGIAENNKDGAWALFLSRAVWRFDKWAENPRLRTAMEEENCPPLDVAMVWHTYCLVGTVFGVLALLLYLTRFNRILEHTTKIIKEDPLSGNQL